MTVDRHVARSGVHGKRPVTAHCLHRDTTRTLNERKQASLNLKQGKWLGEVIVSAVRKAGVTRFIRIRSLAGEPLKLRHGLSGHLTVLLDDGTPAHTDDLGDGTLAIDLPRGREVLVHAGSRPDLVIAPVAVSEPGAPWGLP